MFYTPTLEDVPASGQIDFFVAGTIQKVATIYFAWENLLNAKYYLSPYYPVLPRNIRFGIAWEFLN
ncbi:MAG: TonB-dependent receptor [Ignavibacteriales bacterium]|nr:TonB-dependent receptor [Ignavibacteriales bacterium]